jgi:hypothetical protein
MKKIISGVSGIVAIILPVFASAQGTLPSSPIMDVSGFQQFLCTVVVGWMFTFLVVLSIVFILIAAFKYLTASGDPEKVKSASHTLIYAVIAVAVGLLARGVPLIVGSFIGGNANVGC